MTANILICQKWSIVQFGIPCIEGVFCSLHRDEALLQAFVEEYWSHMPYEAPDTYARPAQKMHRPLPYYRCTVDPKSYKRVIDSGIGLWSTIVPADTVEAISMIPLDQFISLLDGIR